MNTKNPKTKEKYIEGIGRRKEATARVRLYETKNKETSFVVNDKFSVEEYFPTERLQSMAKGVFRVVSPSKPFVVSAHVSGGGTSSQAEALRLGLARAILLYDIEQRTILKRAGMLKRDPREKERKKFGKKKARKSAQWSKR